MIDRNGRLTVNAQLTTLPPASDAVAVTAERPRGRALAGGLKVTGLTAPHPPLVVIVGYINALLHAERSTGVFGSGQFTNAKGAPLLELPWLIM